MRVTTRGLCRVLLALAYLFQLVCGFGLLFSSTTLTSQTTLQDATLDGETATVKDNADQQIRHKMDPWLVARKELRDPECCVVSVYTPRDKNNATNESNQVNNNNNNNNNNDDDDNPLAAHLALLQERLADTGPSDIDMRVRIDTTTMDSAVRDCLGVCKSILEAGGNNNNNDNDKDENLLHTAQSLATFSVGMASFAEDCLDSCPGVFLRIVCASSYSAHDPVFHTDKAPLRGYATLKGVGTEFVTHPCSILEYVGLRSLGLVQDSRRVRRAVETEFIVMKGDYYYSNNNKNNNNRKDVSVSSSWWQRAFACVHRSPPGVGGRRVILSFDLADGDDDREWHDVHHKRQWRAGMTQRKSKLVA